MDRIRINYNTLVLVVTSLERIILHLLDLPKTEQGLKCECVTAELLKDNGKIYLSRSALLVRQSTNTRSGPTRPLRFRHECVHTCEDCYVLLVHLSETAFALVFGYKATSKYFCPRVVVVYF